MRSEKLISEKEVFNSVNSESGQEKETERRPSFSLFPERIQEREETFMEFEESFPAGSQERTKLFREYQLRDRLFWLFIEYFFLSSNIPLKEFIDGLEKKIILRTLNKVNGSQKKAAKILRIKYSTLNEKIKRYNIHFKTNPF